MYSHPVEDAAASIRAALARHALSIEAARSTARALAVEHEKRIQGAGSGSGDVPSAPAPETERGY